MRSHVCFDGCPDPPSTGTYPTAVPGPRREWRNRTRSDTSLDFCDRSHRDRRTSHRTSHRNRALSRTKETTSVTSPQPLLLPILFLFPTLPHLSSRPFPLLFSPSYPPLLPPPPLPILHTHTPFLLLPPHLSFHPFFSFLPPSPVFPLPCPSPSSPPFLPSPTPLYPFTLLLFPFLSYLLHPFPYS